MRGWWSNFQSEVEGLRTWGKVGALGVLAPKGQGAYNSGTQEQPEMSASFVEEGELICSI